MSYEFPPRANRPSTTPADDTINASLVVGIAIAATIAVGIIAFVVASLTFGSDQAVAASTTDATNTAPVASGALEFEPVPVLDQAADITDVTDTGDASQQDVLLTSDTAIEDDTPEIDTPTPASNDAATANPSAPTQHAPTEPAATQRPSSTQAAPVEPFAPAPAPAPFRPVCSISERTIEVGETTIFSGTHTPADVWVSWSFDHGDGYHDVINPSYALYHQPGTYHVTGWAESATGVHEVPCGTVTVVAPYEPIEFHCAISDTQLEVGETTVFTASTDPHDLDVTWTFDHGDGYQEVANPSYAVYHQPGTYHVTAHASIDGESTRVDCGSVTVVAPLPAPQCSTSGYVGLLVEDARRLAESRGCEHRTLTGLIETVLAEAELNPRPNRVNFVAAPVNPLSVLDLRTIVVDVFVG